MFLESKNLRNEGRKPEKKEVIEKFLGKSCERGIYKILNHALKKKLNGSYFLVKGIYDVQGNRV